MNGLTALSDAAAKVLAKHGDVSLDLSKCKLSADAYMLFYRPEDRDDSEEEWEEEIGRELDS